MKCLHISTYDLLGGAAKVANRLNFELNTHGVESKLYVAIKTSEDENVIVQKSILGNKSLSINRRIDNMEVLKYFSRKKDSFSVSFWGKSLDKIVKEIQPDIVHIHWLNFGFIKLESVLAIDIPIVWTLHDAWPFTGGCHVANDCERYMDFCNHCPILRSGQDYDLSSRIFLRKLNLNKNKKIHYIAPSQWMGELAKKSMLLKGSEISIIPNGINVDKFKPKNQEGVRNELGIDQEKFIILFGGVYATKDKNKGFNLLLEAIKIFLDTNLIDQDRVELHLFGTSIEIQEVKISIKIKSYGYIKDELEMAKIYSSADIMIVPSIQESFGLTTIESMSCGTPVVGFQTSGIAELITHKKNGFLATPFEVVEIAEGIKWVFTELSESKQLSLNSRNIVKEKFDIKRIVEIHANLYKEILQ